MTTRELILLTLLVVGAIGLFNALGRDILKTGLALVVAGAIGLAASWFVDGGETAAKLIGLIGGDK